MKNRVLRFVPVAVAMLALVSCNEKAKLAADIEGSWNGVAERVPSSDAKATVTVTREFTFKLDSADKTSGTVVATVPFSIETGTPLMAAEVQPIAVTASGTATINGTWKALDDDDVSVVYDMSSLAVDVLPQETDLLYNVATGESAPVEDAVKPVVAEAIKRLVKRDFPVYVFNYAKISDIKVKGNLLSCEIADRDFSFHRDN